MPSVFLICLNKWLSIHFGSRSVQKTYPNKHQIPRTLKMSKRNVSNYTVSRILKQNTKLLYIYWLSITVSNCLGVYNTHNIQQNILFNFQQP